MSRPLRIEYPGAWYNVMNRGRRLEVIFKISAYSTVNSIIQTVSKLIKSDRKKGSSLHLTVNRQNDKKGSSLHLTVNRQNDMKRSCHAHLE